MGEKGRSGLGVGWREGLEYVFPVLCESFQLSHRSGLFKMAIQSSEAEAALTKIKALFRAEYLPEAYAALESFGEFLHRKAVPGDRHQ